MLLDISILPQTSEELFRNEKNPVFMRGLAFRKRLYSHRTVKGAKDIILVPATMLTQCGQQIKTDVRDAAMSLNTCHTADIIRFPARGFDSVNECRCIYDNYNLSSKNKAVNQYTLAQTQISLWEIKWTIMHLK